MRHHTTTATATAATVILAAASLAACTSDTTRPHSNNAAVIKPAHASPTPPTAAAPDTPNCRPVINGAGITIHDGHVTATATLHCDSDTTPSYVPVYLNLFYRPNTHVGTTTLADAAWTRWQPAYSTSATCRPGLWYAGEVVNATPTKGATVTVTRSQCER